MIWGYILKYFWMYLFDRYSYLLNLMGNSFPFFQDSSRELPSLYFGKK